MMDITVRHQALYGSEPKWIVRAPGRINLIGEHIDYHGGLVMPAAIEQHLTITFSMDDSLSTQVYSMDYDSDYRPADAVLNDHSWKRYIHHILEIAAIEDLHVSSFQATIRSDIPTGSGLSSSAALCTGLISGLNEMHGWNLDLLEIARFGQAVEHALGVNCGLMDQYAVLHGKENKALLLDCLTDTHEYVSANLSDCVLVLLQSGVKHALVDSAYNDRRSNSESALQIINAQFPQASSYRAVTAEMVQRTHGLTDAHRDLASFVIEEIERVRQAAIALSTEDARNLGRLICESHEGLRSKYRVTCEETDYLVDKCLEHDSVLGARQLGGGFGGCVLVLVGGTDIGFKESVAVQYRERFDIALESLMVQISGGVSVDTIR